MADKKDVDSCIERLCQKGCRAVWDDIAALERGDPLPETQGLAGDEISIVLNELKAVMAVYEGTCSAD